MRAQVAFLVTIAVVLAGCTSSEGTPQTTTTREATAAPPTVDASTGSIAGVVVNEEALPVPSASVGLSTGPTTETDAAGRFTFNELQPGSYTVTAARLGFSSAGRRVDVLAAEVTEVTISLKALTIVGEAFTHTIPKVHLIVLGNAYTQFATQQANVSGTHEALCNACVVVLHFPPKPQGILTEALWPCGCQPYINQDVWIKYLKDWTTGATLDGDVLINTYLSNREQYVWGQTLNGQTVGKDLAQTTKILFQMHAGNYVNQENRVSTWHSFVYNSEDFPENFTAMPPG